jgi:hypothetical protein
MRRAGDAFANLAGAELRYERPFGNRIGQIDVSDPFGCNDSKRAFDRFGAAGDHLLRRADLGKDTAAKCIILMAGLRPRSRAHAHRTIKLPAIE